MTSDQAKEQLLSAVKEDVKHETAMYVKEMETRAKEDARKKAKEYVVTAIQKCAVDHVAETTISLVQLPNDEMKGRIIGREGRNIRSIENATGVELIIDDTPEAVVLSSFNPVRREIARIALEKLIVDGRIHPARIEEMVEKATKEVETMMREEGEAATLELGFMESIRTCQTSWKNEVPYKLWTECVKAFHGSCSVIRTFSSRDRCRCENGQESRSAS